MPAHPDSTRTVRQLHDRAMRAVDRAEAARRAGAKYAEFQQTKRALRLELRAGALAAERGASVVTLTTLARSAGNLALRVTELIG